MIGVHGIQTAQLLVLLVRLEQLLPILVAGFKTIHTTIQRVLVVLLTPATVKLEALVLVRGQRVQLIQHSRTVPAFQTLMLKIKRAGTLRSFKIQVSHPVLSICRMSEMFLMVTLVFQLLVHLLAGVALPNLYV